MIKHVAVFPYGLVTCFLFAEVHQGLFCTKISIFGLPRGMGVYREIKITIQDALIDGTIPASPAVELKT